MADGAQQRQKRSIRVVGGSKGRPIGNPVLLRFVFGDPWQSSPLTHNLSFWKMGGPELSVAVRPLSWSFADLGRVDIVDSSRAIAISLEDRFFGKRHVML